MEFYLSRDQVFLPLVAGLVLVGILLLMMVFAGVVGLVGGGLGLLAIAPFVGSNGARLLRADRPELVLDDWGVHDDLRGWEAPWEAVRAVWVYRTDPDVMARFTVLCFEIDHADLVRRAPDGVGGRFVRLIDAANRYAGRPELGIPFRNLEPGVEAAMAYVREIRPELVRPAR